MYKCKECGNEYDIKPDFCDCGNDEFEQIITQKPNPVLQATETVNPKPLRAEQAFPAQKKTEKKTFSEQYPALSRFVESLDPISASIFGLCLILSIVVIFFVWNPEVNQENKQNTEKKEPAISKNIPSIDKFWNNTPPSLPETKTTTKQENPIETAANIVKQVLPAPKQAVQKQNITATPVAVQQKPKTATTAQKKANATKSTPKTNTQPKTNQNQTANTTPKQTQQNAKKPVTQSTQTTQPNTKPIENKTAETTTATLPKFSTTLTVQQINTAAARQELENYKAQLRNTIGRKIDFTKVVGDGDCTVAFKINSSGKLVNRSFAKQSSNITLNDAVYAAVMATPSYNPPPSAYNDETLRLYIRFYNGNFEISLK